MTNTRRGFGVQGFSDFVTSGCGALSYSAVDEVTERGLLFNWYGIGWMRGPPRLWSAIFGAAASDSRVVLYRRSCRLTGAVQHA